ncbi:MAG: ammonium transporter [Gammaproteobacteria bacterium]|nr:ammonium transporter [Gammaproteobacteria bacterium]
MTNPRTVGAVLAAMLSVAATSVSGQTLDSGDTAWLSMSSALVLFMTIPGLALFYGGLVRSNNVLSVLLQCFAITATVTVVWFVAGYSLAFGDTVSAVIGDTSRFFYRGMAENALIASVPESVFATFQLTFAIIAPALIVGAFVERMRFAAVLLFSVAWSLLVYSPVAHWVWGGGWLGQLGLLDYAGGTVVHVTAGTAAIVAAMVLGPRQGFPERTHPPHSTVLAVVGAAMLWVGWFGFNGGSALGANGDATMSIVVTQLAASAGVLVWMGMEWIRNGKPTAVGAIIGAIAGLASITPASGFVGPLGALAMSVAGAFLCFVMTGFIKRTLKIDDSLDVFPVHAVGGGFGTVLAAVFASDSLGPFAGQHAIDVADQLGVQALGLIAVASYTAVATWVILKIVGAVATNRVAAKDESDGLDLIFHGERGYVMEMDGTAVRNADPAVSADSRVSA